MLKVLAVKNLCLREHGYALKDTFFLIHFLFQSLQVFKNSFKNVKCKMGGEGQKSPKKSVTYYLNGP